MVHHLKMHRNSEVRVISHLPCKCLLVSGDLLLLTYMQLCVVRCCARSGMNNRNCWFKTYKCDINGCMKTTWRHKIIAKIHVTFLKWNATFAGQGHDAREYRLMVIWLLRLREKNKEDDGVKITTELMCIFLSVSLHFSTVTCLYPVHPKNEHKRAQWQNLMCQCGYSAETYTTFKLETSYVSQRSVPLPQMIAGV